MHLVSRAHFPLLAKVTTTIGGGIARASTVVWCAGVICAALAGGAAHADGARVAPEVVDARGEADAMVTVPASGHYRVQVTSAAGTACALADQLRGPFASGGEVGVRSCDFDVLLDAGIYKLRLQSPEKGSGRAQVRVTPFADVALTGRLDEGQSATASLGLHQTLSLWLAAKDSAPTTIEVVGRTAGAVELWRDGVWVESIEATHEQWVPRSEMPMHRWRIDAVLEPGEYRLVVAGTDPTVATKGGDDDTVFVTRGAPPAHPARTQRFKIPLWGFMQVMAPEPRLTANVEINADAESRVLLSAEAVTAGTRTHRQATCSIAPGERPAFCSLTTDRADAHVLMIEGPPGTTGQLTWAAAGTETSEGYWPVDSLPTLRIGAAGTYQVSAPQLPFNVDQAPIACMLEQLDKSGNVTRQVAVDAPEVSWTEPFERVFNFDATSTAVWVRVTKPGLYEVRGNPDRKASCEVNRIDTVPSTRAIAGEDDKCSATKFLAAGLYEVRFYGGRPGIQTLRFAQVGLSGKATTPAKGGCSFANVALTAGTYRVRTSGNGAAEVRGLFWRPAPMNPQAAASALPIVVEPHAETRVALAAGAGAVVVVPESARLTCALSGAALPLTSGACRTGALAAAAELVLKSDSDVPIAVIVSADRQTAAAAPLTPFTPTPPRLETLSAGAPRYFNLDREAQRSLLVNVGEDGLYDVASLGLLATRCRLRTPSNPGLVVAEQNGRGRNCQLQAYLKRGTYLFSVSTLGQSRGRLGVAVERRAARTLAPLVLGVETYDAVNAGELAQRTFETKKRTELALSVAAQDAHVSCRVDDRDGWPVFPVPLACDSTETFAPGRYTLTTLPLTVPSRRVTRVGEIEQSVVLQGDAVHALVLNKPARALLGADGKDQFAFTLSADTDVSVFLDHGMQGRIVRSDDAAREIVDVVPPLGGGGLAVSGTADVSDAAADEGGEAGEEYSEEGDQGEEASEYSDEGEGAEEVQEQSADAPPQNWAALRASAAAMERATKMAELPALTGHVVHLAAGKYALEAEHSRGDVAIQYGVSVNVRALIPGAAVDNAPVPGRIDVIVPARARASMIRIHTRGAVDPRCRLRDSRGDLVAESAQSGADWNCAFALPLAAGTYALELEAEALRPGTTQVQAELLEQKDTGELADGNAFRAAMKVASALLPAQDDGAVTDVKLEGDGEFSCAAEDEKGNVVARQLAVRTCRLLLWSGKERSRFRVSLWSPDKSVGVKAHVTQRRIDGTSGGRLSSDRVGRFAVPEPGRYQTGKDVLCRATSRGAGALTPCSDGLAAERGDVLVASLEGADVPLREELPELDKLTTAPRTLTADHAPERARTRGDSLQLAVVSVPFGSSGEPVCVIDGGARALSAATCAAASGRTRSAVLRAWTRTGAALGATVTRQAVPWPDAAPALPVGVTTQSLAAPVGAFGLAAGRIRLDLALPVDAWAVLVDSADTPVELCAPRRRPAADPPAKLRTCTLLGNDTIAAGGGRLIIVAGARRDLRVTHTRLAAPTAPRALVGIDERSPAGPAVDALIVAAAPTARILRVEAQGAVRCTVQLDDGTRASRCRVAIPAGVSAHVSIAHDGRPYRAYAFAAGDGWAARFGAVPAPPARRQPAQPGVAEPLAGARVERTLLTDAPQLIRVRATDGVCAVQSNGAVVYAGGLGNGCDAAVPVQKGAHRIFVRAFGASLKETQRPLAGALTVDTEPLITLSEGVGPEVMVGPGEARMFAFTLRSDGALGVGVQADGDVLDCALLDGRLSTSRGGDEIATGCHAFVQLRRGAYLLRVSQPADAAAEPRRFKPVVFGLAGSAAAIPEAYLRDFFRRIDANDLKETP